MNKSPELRNLLCKVSVCTLATAVMTVPVYCGLIFWYESKHHSLPSGHLLSVSLEIYWKEEHWAFKRIFIVSYYSQSVAVHTAEWLMSWHVEECSVTLLSLVGSRSVLAFIKCIDLKILRHVVRARDNGPAIRNYIRAVVRQWLRSGHPNRHEDNNCTAGEKLCFLHSTARAEML
jgi:hypothetical protein